MRLLHPSRALVVFAVVVIVAALFGASGLQQAGKANFDHTYPDFIKDNEAVLRRLKSQPASNSRDQIIKGIKDNLAWADEYKRTGFDPEIYNEIAFKKELAARTEQNVESGLQP